MADKQDDINKNYPLSVFRYTATIGGDDFFFSEISGLNIEYETTEYEEATTEGAKTYQLIGQKSAPVLTLKRGLFKDGLELYAWLNSTDTCDFEKKDLVISWLDNDNNKIMTWTVANAFMTKYEGPSLDATSNDVAFQSIDVKGDYLTVS